MAASSLILALLALWTGPIWGQDRSGAGPIVPVRVFRPRRRSLRVVSRVARVWCLCGVEDRASSSVLYGL